MMAEVEVLYDVHLPPVRAGEKLSDVMDIGAGWKCGRNVQGQIVFFPGSHVRQSRDVLLVASVEPNDGPIQRYNRNMPFSDESDSDDEDVDRYMAMGDPRLLTSNNMQQYVQYGGDYSLESENAYMALNSSDDYVRLSSLQLTHSDQSDQSDAESSEDPPSPYDLQSLIIEQCATIVQRNGSLFYEAVQSPYTVSITRTESKTKFFNSKRYICYHITSPFGRTAHRFKHFSWLNDRLMQKCASTLMPPLVKQMFGRFSVEFIHNRRGVLQEFLNWISHHPILSNCPAVVHFLTCSDEAESHAQWKQGKRAIERDALDDLDIDLFQFSGFSQSEVTQQIDICSQFVSSMQNSVDVVIGISNESKIPIYNFTRVGLGISMLAKSLKIDEQRIETDPNTKLSTLMELVANSFIDIAKLIHSHLDKEIAPIANCLAMYRGIVANIPNKLNKVRSQRSGDADVNRHNELMSYAAIAEVNHFYEHREQHLKDATKRTVQEKIKLHKHILELLETVEKSLE